jgi:hypothetical protein
MAILASGGGPAVTVVRWVARALSILLFYYGGAFFIEHLEMFRAPRVWHHPEMLGRMALHLAFLLALIAGWRWEVIGAVVSIATSAVFLSFSARPQAVWALIALTAIPGVLWLVCAGLTLRRGGAAVLSS